ncbi:MAG: hypothetical protein WBD28_07890 [Candidatus Zixiibacteriota bacterium]
MDYEVVIGLEVHAQILTDSMIFGYWVMSEVLRELKQRKIGIKDFKLTSEGLTDLLQLIDENLISTKIAREVFREMVQTGKSAEEIVEKKGLSQLSDKDEIQSLVNSVLDENEEQVKRYMAGKEKLFGFFVGEVMKKSKGKANPNLVNEILKEKLKK